MACGLAAMCYAEFASTVPVAGSAYTFSHATFGEFVAWVIGWDLILEFAVAAAVVAKGWSSYLGTVFGFGGGTADFGWIQLDWGALVIIATGAAAEIERSARLERIGAFDQFDEPFVGHVGGRERRVHPEARHHGGHHAEDAGIRDSAFSIALQSMRSRLDRRQIVL
jgi:hypothetical protein